MSKTTRMERVLLGALALGLASSCSPEQDSERPDADLRPNVLLVTIDTTRADHLGTYGYKHAFTPTIDALAKKSIKFNRAFCSIAETLPSHTTIMTGLHPFYHGVMDNSHFTVSPVLTTLAEVLKGHGYQTGAAVAAFVLDSDFGLDQGFDTYDDEVRPNEEFAPFEIPERRASAVNDSAIDWLKSIDHDQPFFLWAHYYDPHSRYDAPISFTKYQGFPYDVEIAYTDEQLGRLLNYIDQDLPGKRPTLVVVTADHGEGLGQYGERTHAYFAYDSTLHVPLLVRMPDKSHAGLEIDLPVGVVDLMPTILDVLKLPVPSANDIHGRSLLPLIRSPKQPPADLVDRPMAVESYDPHYTHGWAAIRGVRVGETKFLDVPQPELYILSENPKELPENNRYEDRPELVARMTSAYHELYNTELSVPRSTTKPEQPNQDTLEKLRALGYVGNAVAPEDVGEGTGKDLKEMLPVYRDKMMVASLISSGHITQAAQLFVKLIGDEPGSEALLRLAAELAARQPQAAAVLLPTLEKNLAEQLAPPSIVPSLWVDCGRIYLERNEDAKALDYFSKAATADDNYAAAYWWQSLACLRLNRYAAAVQAMSRAAELFGPDVPRAQVVLGLALFADGQSEQGAEQWGKLFSSVQTTEPVWWINADCSLGPTTAGNLAPTLQRAAANDHFPPLVRAALAVVASQYLAQLGEHEQSLANLELAWSLLPEHGAEINLAIATAQLRLGQVDRARELFEEAYRLAPDRCDIAASLAGVLERVGEIDQAATLLDTYYQKHPESLPAANNLAWILAQQGKDLDRAMKLAKQLVEKQTLNPVVLDTAGWIYHLRGDKEMAIDHLSRAANLQPDSAGYQYHLGVALQAAERLPDARRAFAKAIELAPSPRPAWFEDARRALDGL